MRAPGNRGPDFQPGDRFGDYQIVRLIATGGQSQLYEARHLLLGRRDALKFLVAPADDDGLARARLQDEARLLVELGDHPNLPRIYTMSLTAEGYLFMALEFLAGRDLRDLLGLRGRLTPLEVAVLGAEVANALEPAHARGVVHRDLKPENLFITTPPSSVGAVPDPKARVRVLDFGVAKLRRAAKRTQQGVAMGTPHYMAPEQARGDEVDGRSDVYALAAILWECLVGRHMFARPMGELPPSAEIVLMQLEVTPPAVDSVRPDVSPALAAAVARGLAKDPGARFASMAELGASLRAEIARAPAFAEPDLFQSTPPAQRPAPTPLDRVLPASARSAVPPVPPSAPAERASFPDTLRGPPTSLRQPPPSAPSGTFATPVASDEDELYPQLVVVASEDPSLPAGAVIELAGSAFWLGWHRAAHIVVAYDADAAIGAELEVAPDGLRVRPLDHLAPAPPTLFGAGARSEAPLPHGRGFAIAGMALRFLAHPDARYRPPGEPPARVVACGLDAAGSPALRRVIAARRQHLPADLGAPTGPRLVVRASTGELDAEARARGEALVQAGTVWPLTGPRLLIGRDPAVSLPLHERTVSARHALLVATLGRYVLFNLSRTNGTLVAGRPVSAHVLVDGDEIVVGDTTLTYRVGP